MENRAHLYSSKETRGAYESRHRYYLWTPGCIPLVDSRGSGVVLEANAHKPVELDKWDSLSCVLRLRAVVIGVVF